MIKVGDIVTLRNRVGTWIDGPWRVKEIGKNGDIGVWNVTTTYSCICVWFNPYYFKVIGQ